MGEKLFGRLFSHDQKSAVYPSPSDASVVFETAVGVVPPDAQGPAPRATTTIIAADPKKVAKALKLRAEITGEASSTASETGGKIAELMRWLPFGERGWRQRRAMEKAKAHLGEVFVSITYRDVVVSTAWLIRLISQTRICALFVESKHHATSASL